MCVRAHGCACVRPGVGLHEVGRRGFIFVRLDAHQEGSGLQSNCFVTRLTGEGVGDREGERQGQGEGGDRPGDWGSRRRRREAICPYLSLADPESRRPATVPAAQSAAAVRQSRQVRAAAPAAAGDASIPAPPTHPERKRVRNPKLGHVPSPERLEVVGQADFPPAVHLQRPRRRRRRRRRPRGEPCAAGAPLGGTGSTRWICPLRFTAARLATERRCGRVEHRPLRFCRPAPAEQSLQQPRRRR